MSYAPQTIAALAAYWTAQGGKQLGIVGDANHTKGYHLGKDRIFSATGQGWNDYSVQHVRDKAGLSNAASALDLGRLNGSLAELYRFSEWLVADCFANPASRYLIREIIYWSVKNKRVQRYSGWDNRIYWGPGNGDASHEWHTHISFPRDTEKAEKIGLFAPFFLTPPDTSTGDKMQKFVVPEAPTLVMVPKGTKLYPASDLTGTPTIIDPGRKLWYVGLSDVSGVRIVAYEPPTEDANASSVAMFVTASAIGPYEQAPIGADDGIGQEDVDAARAAGIKQGAKDEQERLAVASGNAEAARIRSL